MDKNVSIKKYIDTACGYIPYKKLRNRIRQELSDHIADMLDDYINICGDYTEAVEKALLDMGNPEELGKELKLANKKALVPFYMKRVLAVVITVMLIPVVLIAGESVIESAYTYNHGKDIASMEKVIVEDMNNGEPIKLLTEFEYEGYLYRFYIPEENDAVDNPLFYTQSIKFLGYSVYDKFGVYGSQRGLLFENCHRVQKSNYSETIWAFVGKPETKYVKLFYEPIDPESELESYWSDYIAVPQTATYERPLIVMERKPDGYMWSMHKCYDENKKEFTPENNSTTVSSSEKVY